MQNPIVPEITFVDIPEVTEIFSDSSRSVTYDGQTMRIDFCATRMDEPNPPNQPTGRQYPVCRLVLTPNAAIDLFNKLQQIMVALEQRGALKKNFLPPQTPSTMQ